MNTPAAISRPNTSLKGREPEGVIKLPPKTVVVPALKAVAGMIFDFLTLAFWLNNDGVYERARQSGRDGDFESHLLAGTTILGFAGAMFAPANLVINEGEGFPMWFIVPCTVVAVWLFLPAVLRFLAYGLKGVGGWAREALSENFNRRFSAYQRKMLGQGEEE